MAVIVDASAIGAIAFGEPEGPTLAAHLEGETLLAPALFDYELTSLALKKARRQPDSAAAIAAALAVALNLPIRRVAVPGLESFRQAARDGLTAYDAAYLWLAESRDVELVTLDRHLERIHAERENRRR